MISGIYYIKNNINNKYYIGQSVNIKQRKQQHFAELRHNTHRNAYLQNAFNKHGENAFEFKLIKACKPRYLNRFEKLYIKIYDSYDNGYNLTEGGENPPILKGKNNPMYGRKLPRETKQKISEALKGKKHTPEARQKMSKANSGENNPMYACKHTQETKQKISKTKSGKSLAKSTKLKISSKMNSTGYYRVYKHIDKKYRQGFIYQYQYYDKNHKRVSISSVDINKLEEKVKSKELPWCKLKD